MFKIIQDPGWGFGHTNGAFQGKQYFDKPCQVSVVILISSFSAFTLTRTQFRGGVT